jgi:predicted AlkP superfamily pyrophosphatase or phosphodiesterase
MKGSPRIPPVWILPDEGWSVDRRSYFETVKNHFTKGEHGYDPAYPRMRGILIVNGPAFKAGGVAIEPVENIHIYNLLCAALHLAPAPNDGDDRLMKAFLR